MPRTIAEEFQRRISLLEGMGFVDAPHRLTGILDWLESEPITHSIIAQLRNETDIEALLKDCRPHCPPKASTPDEVARVGLYVFERCKAEPSGLAGLLLCFGCHTSANNFDYDIPILLRKYVVPFLKYAADNLARAPQHVTIEQVVEMRRDVILSPDFEKDFAQTQRLWRNLSKEMGGFIESENWFNIANSCREVMKQFTPELLSHLNLPKPGELKDGDFKGLAKHILSLKMKDGRGRDALLLMTSSTWDYVACLLHNNATSRTEALRAYLWTGVLVSEILEQLK